MLRTFSELFRLCAGDNSTVRRGALLHEARVRRGDADPARGLRRRRRSLSKLQQSAHREFSLQKSRSAYITEQETQHWSVQNVLWLRVLTSFPSWLWSQLNSSLKTEWASRLFEQSTTAFWCSQKFRQVLLDRSFHQALQSLEKSSFMTAKHVAMSELQCKRKEKKISRSGIRARCGRGVISLNLCAVGSASLDIQRLVRGAQIRTLEVWPLGGWALTAIFTLKDSPHGIELNNCPFP